MKIPDFIYELLPAFYISCGTLTLLGLGNAWISGILLILAGVFAYEMRLEYRTGGKS